jgi:hypothetical protein
LFGILQESKFLSLHGRGKVRVKFIASPLTLALSHKGRENYIHNQDFMKTDVPLFSFFQVCPDVV